MPPNLLVRPTLENYGAVLQGKFVRALGNSAITSTTPTVLSLLLGVPAAYALAPQALKLPAKQILFVSGNGWDVIGATWFGYTTLWVNRQGLPLEQLDTEPSRTGSSLRDVLDFFPEPSES